MDGQIQLVKANLAKFYEQPRWSTENDLIVSLQQLGESESNREAALVCLLSMTGERPWGDQLEPKVWRRLIKETIARLLNLSELYQALLLGKYIAEDKLRELWENLFDPLHIVDPVLNAIVDGETYYPAVAKEINMLISVLEKVLLEKDLDEGTKLWCDFDDFLGSRYTAHEIASYSSSYPALLRSLAGAVFK